VLQVCDFNHKWAKIESVGLPSDGKKYVGLFTERVWEKAHPGQAKVE
jgi:hypothetical protein